MGIKRFEVYLVGLDPTVGSEIRKTRMESPGGKLPTRNLRPCVVISPDEINQRISHVIIAPMTTKIKKYPTHVACTFQEKQGSVVLDQIRTVDKARLVKLLGVLEFDTCRNILQVLQEMFS